jgi:hypothetical protein
MTSRSLRFCHVALAVLATLPVFASEKMKEPVPPAPIPARILSGKKAFVSYAGLTSSYLTPYVVDHTGSVNGLYDEFYAAMKSWGRYDLVSDPGDADLVFEVSLIWQRQADPSFGLKIFDPKTHVVLWAFIETVPAGSGRNRVKAWDNALAKIVNDAKQLADQPAVPAGALNH